MNFPLIKMQHETYSASKYHINI